MMQLRDWKTYQFTYMGPQNVHVENMNGWDGTIHYMVHYTPLYLHYMDISIYYLSYYNGDILYGDIMSYL